MKNEIPKMMLNLGRQAQRDDFSFAGSFLLEIEGGGAAQCTTGVQGTIDRRGGRLFLRATIDSRIELECSRCLNSFELRIETGFDLVFHREERAQVPEGLEEEDFILLTDTIERRYDIFPKVRESILLEMPIRFLCAQDCKGLCPNCGANLNSGGCGCSGREADPRWDALKKLLSEENSC